MGLTLFGKDYRVCSAEIYVLHMDMFRGWGHVLNNWECEWDYIQCLFKIMKIAGKIFEPSCIVFLYSQINNTIFFFGVGDRIQLSRPILCLSSSSRWRNVEAECDFNISFNAFRSPNVLPLASLRTSFYLLHPLPTKLQFYDYLQFCQLADSVYLSEVRYMS